MKLVVQIPCLNEEKTIEQVINQIPKKIKGIDEILVLIIDDGCSDRTCEIAEKLGCIILSNKKNMGLGNSFRFGQMKALELGADILVNTDGDDQYPGKYITDLVRKLIDCDADIVIGDRETSKIEHFSPIKKFLQFLGSKTVNVLSDNSVKDTVSGFRAYSKEALIELNVTSKFSYVIDTIIQASKKNLKIEEILIKTNRPTRKSRLFKNIFEHIKKSTTDMVRVYVMYEPLKFFTLSGLFFLFLSLVLFLRFLFYYLAGYDGLIQSLIISGVLFGVFLSLLGLGIIGDINNKNRMLLEEIIINQRREKFEK